jgi:calcineurin-like phosphoesterase family protein
MKSWNISAGVLVCAITLVVHAAAQQTPDWGSGVAPFAFALIGDMPYGPAREAQFARVVAEINRDNDVDFVMHAGDIKAGSERCDDSLIRHRFDLYQSFQRAFVYTPGDNEWTDCHRANNGQYNPLERLAFVRSVFFPQTGRTTGGQLRPVRSQADGSTYSEFVENVMFRSQSVMFATVHVVGSNNDLEPWVGISPTDSCTSPRPDRIAEFERRQAAALTWLDEVFAAATDASGVFLLMQANPYDPPSNPAQCPSGFQAFLTRLATRAQQYGKPVMLAHGDDHFFFMDQPLPNPLFSRVQTYGEAKVHWLKVHVDPKSSGVFSIEQKIVRGNP